MSNDRPFMMYHDGRPCSHQQPALPYALRVASCSDGTSKALPDNRPVASAGHQCTRSAGNHPERRQRYLWDHSCNDPLAEAPFLGRPPAMRTPDPGPVIHPLCCNPLCSVCIRSGPPIGSPLAAVRSTPQGAAACCRVCEPGAGLCVIPAAATQSRSG